MILRIDDVVAAKGMEEKEKGKEKTEEESESKFGEF